MTHQYQQRQPHETVFQALTGLFVSENDPLVIDQFPNVEPAAAERVNRPGRRRKAGSAPRFTLIVQPQTLLNASGLSQYPPRNMVSSLFGLSRTSAGV